jgi:hypothetical protein
MAKAIILRRVLIHILRERGGGSGVDGHEAAAAGRTGERGEGRARIRPQQQGLNTYISSRFSFIFMSRSIPEPLNLSQSIG